MFDPAQAAMSLTSQGWKPYSVNRFGELMSYPYPDERGGVSVYARSTAGDPTSARHVQVIDAQGIFQGIAGAIEAQKNLCLKNKLPHFAPPNGVCWNCRRQIYELLSGNEFVTGCPWCHRSYCD